MPKHWDDAFELIRTGEADYIHNTIVLNDLRKDEIEYKTKVWRGNVNPSRVKFGMCPAHFYQVEVHKNKRNKSEDLERMGTGSMFHKHYNDKALQVPDFLAPKPDYTLMNEATSKPLDLTKWPSIPFYDPDFDLSGEIDLAILVSGKPLVVELKFPQQRDPKTWVDFTRKTFPSIQYITQGAIYCYVARKYKFWATPPEQFMLWAKNPYMEEHEYPIKQVIYDYAPYEDRVISLLTHCAEHARNYKEGRKILTCTYPECPKCSKK